MMIGLKPNTFVLTAPDSTATQGTVPETETIPGVFYAVLIHEPYTYTERELQRKVHFDIRKKPHLKIENYNIRRSPLCKQFGWGLHADHAGKLAIYGCETEEYKRFASSRTLKIVNAFRTRGVS